MCIRCEAHEYVEGARDALADFRKFYVECSRLEERASKQKNQKKYRQQLADTVELLIPECIKDACALEACCDALLNAANNMSIAIPAAINDALDQVHKLRRKLDIALMYIESGTIEHAVDTVVTKSNVLYDMRDLDVLDELLLEFTPYFLDLLNKDEGECDDDDDSSAPYELECSSPLLLEEEEEEEEGECKKRKRLTIMPRIDNNNKK